MSSLLSAITGELGGDSLQGLAGAIGASPDQTQKAVSAALPALIGGLAKNASSDEGASALANALDRDHQEPLHSQLGNVQGLLGALGGGGDSGGGGLLGAAMGALGGGGDSGGGGVGSLLGAAMGMMSDSSGSSDRPKGLDGAGILGHIFGGKQQNVEEGVAKASGLDAGTIAKLLPMLAPLVMSALGTLKKEKNLDASGLKNVLAEEQAEVSKDSPGGSILDALDSGNDGIADDLVRIGAGLHQSGALKGLFG